MESKNLEIYKIMFKENMTSETQETRKNLYLISLLSLFIYCAGFIPTKITWAGIELSDKDINSLRIFISLIIIYYFLIFTLRGAMEMWLYFHLVIYNYPEKIEIYNKTPEEIIRIIKNEKNNIEKTKYWKIALFLSLFRIFIEYIIPLCVSITSVIFIYL